MHPTLFSDLPSQGKSKSKEQGMYNNVVVWSKGPTLSLSEGVICWSLDFINLYNIFIETTVWKSIPPDIDNIEPTMYAIIRIHNVNLV